MSTTNFSTKAPAYLTCLQKHETPLETADGRKVEVWELNIPIEEKVLMEWGKCFREHYCLDTEIDILREGTGLSRRDYLFNLVFPDKSNPPGPGVRAGDFAEILIADYLEYIIGYWVPREKYRGKSTRDESMKGVDILGFQLPNPDKPTKTDTLITFEVKAQLTGTSYNDRLQDAINHSSKDYLRRAYSLNATKRRLLDTQDNERALIVQRFQNASDNPYNYRAGAAAVLSDCVFAKDDICNSTNVSGHKNSESLDLLIIHGTDLMPLVHSLYEKAANEA